MFRIKRFCIKFLGVLSWANISRWAASFRGVQTSQLLSVFFHSRTDGSQKKFDVSLLNKEGEGGGRGTEQIFRKEFSSLQQLKRKQSRVNRNVRTFRCLFHWEVFLKMGHSRPLFLYFCLFSTVDSKHSIKIFADDWIRTMALWNWKRPLYQLSHNHCPHWELLLTFQGVNS